MPDPFTDADLIAAYRAGEPDAFAVIYDRYVDRLFSRLVDSGRDRSEAVELTRDSFVKAAEEIIDSDVPGHVGAWLLRLAEESADLSAGDLGELPPTEMMSAPPALRARVLRQTDENVVTPATNPSPSPTVNPYWARMGMFALVALFFGLVGLAVSAQFEPLSLPASPPPPNTEGPGPTTTTTVPPTTTEADSSSTRASTVAALPASIQVAPETVDLGADSTTGELVLTNSGNQAADWRLASTTGAIAVSEGEGTLAGGETLTIELSLDREQVEEGDLAATVTVTWEGGEIEVAVVGTHEDNPIIHDPRATPSSVEVSGDNECINTQATVSARVRDTSELESVVVQWSPDGGGQRETSMDPVGDDMFEAVVGPFTTAQTAAVRVVAVDERGNAGGASTQVSVVECP